MANPIDTTTIRVSTEVKNTLDALKQKKSYSDFISSMTRYFMVTNISPESTQVHPTAHLEKRVEYAISMIKAIEKNKIDVLLKNSRTTKENTPNENIDLDNYIPVEEVQEILLEVENLKKENRTLSSDILKLKTTAELSTPTTEQKTINIKAVDEAIQLILESTKNDTFKKGFVSISKSELESYLERIKEEINVCQG